MAHAPLAPVEADARPIPRGLSRYPPDLGDLDGAAQDHRDDTAGHAAGDHLLRAVARALITGLRPSDTVMRYGGDEFVCVLPGVPLAQARRRLVDVQHLLTAAQPGQGISVGLALHRAAEGVEEVIARADSDLYSRRRSA